MRTPVLLLILILLSAGCSTGGGSGETGGNTEASSETREATSTSRELTLEQLASGSDGLGQRQVVVASSADALSEATGAQVPDGGEGAYLAAFWGEKPTGGYTMEFLSARLEGDRITVRLALEEPPPDAAVSQALTKPYAAAALRNVEPEGENFVLVDRDGRELDWPVRRF